MKQRAITRIDTPRGDLFAFEIDGRIHKTDMEWMADTLRKAFTRLGQVDILIVMKHWDGIDISAAFDGKALATQAEANSHVRKYGVVGAPGWAATMINLLSPLTPVEEKTFDLSEEEEAWGWIEGDTSFADARRRAAERP